MSRAASRIVPVALFAALLASAAPLRAEVFGFGLGVQGGVIQARDGNGTVGTFGVNARLRLIGILAAEARASYSKEGFEAAGVKVLDLEQVPVQLSLQLYPIPLGPVRPYLLAGWGWTYLKASGSWHGIGLDSTQTSGNFVAGAGVDLMIYRKVALVVDFRYSFSDISALDQIATVTGTDVKTTPLTATAGLTFSF